jgi:hypothetical protein
MHFVFYTFVYKHTPLLFVHPKPQEILTITLNNLGVVAVIIRKNRSLVVKK